MLVGVTSMLTDLTMSPGELAVAVEERGFDSLWLPEHSHIPTSRESPWPGSKPGSDEPLPYHYPRYVDLFVSLSMAAAVTSRIRLGSSVCWSPSKIRSSWPSRSPRSITCPEAG